MGASPALTEVLDAVESGVFSPDEPDRFHPITQALRHDDRFFVTADFDAYAAAQQRISERWQDPAAWWRASVINTAKMGYFASDRAIGEYAARIWRARSISAID